MLELSGGADNALRADRPDGGVVGRTRRAIDGYGSIVCSTCRRIFPPTEIEIDHRVPLDEGGMDCEANIMLICGKCHAADRRTGGRSQLPTAGRT